MLVGRGLSPGHTRYVHYGAWLYVYPVGTVLLTKRTMQTLYVTFEPINSAIDGRRLLNVRSHSGGKTLLYALLVVGSRPYRVLFFSSVFPSAQNASFDVARNRPPSATTGSNQKERRRPRFAPPTCYMIQDVMLCTMHNASKTDCGLLRKRGRKFLFGEQAHVERWA